MKGLPTIVLTGLFAVAPLAAASAQGNPSNDELERSLRPTRSLLAEPSRGMREAGSSGVRDNAPVPSPVMALKPYVSPHVAPPHSRLVATAAFNSAPTASLTVQFATNSAELTPSAVNTLTNLGQVLTRASLVQSHFRIEGHTDTAGDPAANKLLSERRAQAVVAFLSSHFSSIESRLEAVGMGQDGLMVQTPPNTPEARNRRVQIINLGS